MEKGRNEGTSGSEAASDPTAASLAASQQMWRANWQKLTRPPGPRLLTFGERLRMMTALDPKDKE
jgi:hypothetical protein